MKYRNNYLSQALLRVDYPRVNDIASERRPELLTRFANEYPKVTPLQQTQIQLSMNAEQPTVDKKLGGYTWAARDNSENQVFELTPEYLSLTDLNKTFTNFDKFFARFRSIFEAFEEIYQIKEFTRIGLRYINEISLEEGNALDWAGYISTDIIDAVFPQIPNDHRLSRSMHHVVSIHEDITLIKNYGIFNPDFPAPIARRQFILDFDCYINGVINRGVILTRVTELNRICEDTFESSISAELRNLMEIIND